MQRFTILILSLLAACFSEAPTSDRGSSSESSSSSSSSSNTSTSASTDSSESTTGLDSSSSDTTESSTGLDPESSSSTTAAEITDWALYFDGAASVRSSDPIDLDLDSDFTVEAWIRVDSVDATGPIVVHRGVGTTGWSLGIEDVQSQIVFGFFDNNGAWNEVIGTDLAALDAGWHHVAGTKHGTSLYLHVDGGVVSTQACTQGLSAPVVPLEIGTSTDTDLIYIGIDDVRISSIARYQTSFTPDPELAADPSTRVLVRSDEGEGAASFDDTASITFELQGVTWIPGNTES